MKHFLDSWLTSNDMADKSINTISSYRNDVSQFIEYLEKNKIEDINTAVLEQYKNSLSDFTVSTINRKCTSVNLFIKYLLDSGENIRGRMKVVSVQKKPYIEDMLEKEDIEKMVNEALKIKDFRAAAIFTTLSNTGMRVSELLKLTKVDAYTYSDSIFIQGKGSKGRHIILPDKVKDSLKKYVESNRYNIEGADNLFTSKKGILTRATVDKIIKKYAVRVGVDLNKAHAHNFRHYFCATLSSLGLPIEVIADLAGHNNINTTRIYTRQSKDKLVEYINRL